MCKDKTEHVEIYFICYKKHDMELFEEYYDEILDTTYWYFNAYLAYHNWLNNFEDLQVGDIVHDLLVVAASRYLIYKVENNEFDSKREKKKILKDLEHIQPELDRIMNIETF